jgi:hypothetical protein
VADIVCGIVESGAVSKADREEESSPDGEADGAGSDAFGEGQAKDTDAHTVDYNIAPSQSGTQLTRVNPFFSNEKPGRRTQ